MGASASSQYELDLKEWEQICAEMAATEAASLATNAPDGADLTSYWAQQCVGLCCELPLRVGYHSTCTAGAFCCCWHPTCDKEQIVLAHHAFHVQSYWWLTRLLLENLCVRPATPWYVYHAEISLIRPPKPQPPKDWCDDCLCKGPECKCDCGLDCDCDCSRMLYHVNRQLRALLCVWSGCHSCHPASVLGPCPCCTWDSLAEVSPARLPSYAKAASCSCDRGVVCESTAARYARWDGEFEEAREARTAAFYQRREAHGPLLVGLPVDAQGEAAAKESDYLAFQDATPPVGLVIERDEAEGGSDCCSDRCQGLSVTGVTLAATGVGCYYAAHAVAIL